MGDIHFTAQFLIFHGASTVLGALVSIRLGTYRPKLTTLGQIIPEIEPHGCDQPPAEVPEPAETSKEA
jgi:hypothetical protein